MYVHGMLQGVRLTLQFRVLPAFPRHLGHALEHPMVRVRHGANLRRGVL